MGMSDHRAIGSSGHRKRDAPEQAAERLIHPVETRLAASPAAEETGQAPSLQGGVLCSPSVQTGGLLRTRSRAQSKKRGLRDKRFWTSQSRIRRKLASCPTLRL